MNAVREASKIRESDLHWLLEGGRGSGLEVNADIEKGGRGKDSLLVSDLLDFNDICVALSGSKVRLELRKGGG